MSKFWDDEHDEMIREHVETHARNRDKRIAQQAFAHDWLDAREKSQQAEADRIEREQKAWRQERQRRSTVTPRITRGYEIERAEDAPAGWYNVWCTGTDGIRRNTFLGSYDECEDHIKRNRRTGDRTKRP